MLEYILSFSFVEFYAFQLKRFLLNFFCCLDFTNQMFNYVQKNSRLRFWMIIDFFLSNFRHFSNFLQLLSNVSWEYVWKPVTNIMRIFPKFRKIMILFPSAIWPSRDQLWIIIEATASPTQFYSLFINYFKQKVSGSLVTRLGS